MDATYREFRVEPCGDSLAIHIALENRSGVAWKAESAAIGWQLFDPETDRFITEGHWTPIPQNTAPGATVRIDLTIALPPEPGGWRIFVSPIDAATGWAYARNQPFLVIDAEVVGSTASVLGSEVTTIRTLRRRNLMRAIPRVFLAPLRTIGLNHRLIRSMARRDILARYRGSFGDVLWTVLNPLLLMTTYFFVFGVVLRTRFGADQSSTGFALYFLAGMLPWLAFSEAAGRAPHVILEHRNFVKKLIFPLETLPVNQVLSGLVTELFALTLFLIVLIPLRGSVPGTAIWLPVLLIPQLLFTLGFSWLIAALGVFFRDLGQIMGFVLTLWFFMSPICYPEASLTSLPWPALPFLSQNPFYILVRAYRAILLDHHPPEFMPLLKLYVLAIVVFLIGHTVFYKLRKSFADVI